MEVAIVPRFLIRRFIADDKKGDHANIGLSSLLLILAIPMLSALRMESIAIPHFCLFQVLFHAPCPGCGITSSIFAIAYGDVLSSWNHNPAGLALCIFVLAQVPLRAAAIKYDYLEERIYRLSRAGNFFVVFILAASWFRNILS